MRAEAQTEEKDERARSEEGEDENEEETHRTTTAKPMATTATATTTEYENVDNYFSELIDNGKAEEDHTEWGKPILEKKMPARKNQANQSEKVREAQEKTKRLVVGNDLQDALTGGTRIHSPCTAHAHNWAHVGIPTVDASDHNQDSHQCSCEGEWSEPVRCTGEAGG